MPRLNSKNVFDPAKLEITPTSFMVEKWCFSALYVCNGNL